MSIRRSILQRLKEYDLSIHALALQLPKARRSSVYRFLGEQNQENDAGVNSETLSLILELLGARVLFTRWGKSEVPKWIKDRRDEAKEND